jgi:hypothetical protein
MMTEKPVVFGVPLTPEFMFKVLALAFSLGLLWGKMDSISNRMDSFNDRLIRVENEIFRRP